jgi:hypothetical protein
LLSNPHFFHNPQKELDLKRIRNQFLIGLLLRGPIIHHWLNLLDSTFKTLGITGKGFGVALVRLVSCFLPPTHVSFDLPFIILLS